MKVSTFGAQFIEHMEGLRTKSYRCSAGVWTIGVGHTTDSAEPFTLTSGEVVTQVRVGQTITVEEARRLFAVDVQQASKIVVRTVKKPMTQEQFDAMVSLALNIGDNAFATRCSVPARFNRGDIDGAAVAFLAWNKADGAVNSGLVRRRRLEKLLFEGETQTVRNEITGPVERRAKPSVPPAPKSIMKSKTAGSAIVLGGGAVLETVKEVTAASKDGVQTWTEFAGSVGVPLALGLVALMAVGFIIWDRWSKLQKDGV